MDHHRTRPFQMNVRLSPEEMQLVRAAAARRGVNVSSYLRGMLTRDVAGLDVPSPYTTFAAGEPRR